MKSTNMSEGEKESQENNLRQTNILMLQYCIFRFRQNLRLVL